MKKSNKKKIIVIIISILALAAISFVILKVTKKEDKKESPATKVEQEIKDYGYVLLDNETTLYKSYFDELMKVLNAEEIDEKQYAEVIVKLFISDFYDLNSKTTKNDVGGLQFIYDKVIDNFVLNAKDTIYKFVENNLNGDRTQKLPSVKAVTITSSEPTTFTYNKENIKDENAYLVKTTWEYNEDLGYQKEATFMLMHVDKKLEIVEIK